MRLFIPFFMMAFAIAISAVEAPRLDKTDLFISGEGGYEMYRIPAVGVTPSGTVLAFCEARKTGSDWGRVDVLMRRSDDGGDTWSDAIDVAPMPADVEPNPAALERGISDAERITLGNPTVITARDGTVHFFYCVDYYRCFYRRSDDDGLTFTDPVEVTGALAALRDSYDWIVCATGPGHGIELRGGRLVAPVWLSLGESGNAHHPSVVTTLYSDDGGDSWHAGEIIAGLGDDLPDPSETMLIELADGRVMASMRNQHQDHRRAVSISTDGASGWSAYTLHDQLFEPICMAGLVRYSFADHSDANRILFSNPDNRFRDEPGENLRARENLTVKLSLDEGATWSVKKVLEPGASAYSDLAVGPEKTIYCLYERGGDKQGTYNYITLARFNLAWLGAE